MKTILLTLSFACVITFGGVFRAEAAPREASPSPVPVIEPAQPAHPIPIPFSGRIFAVDKAARTFTTQNKEKKIRTFEISAGTKITRNTRPATFDDLKEGDEIRGSAMKKGNGMFDVLSVNIGPRPDAAKNAPSAVPAASASGRKAK